jgi:hypothetical protein
LNLELCDASQVGALLLEHHCQFFFSGYFGDKGLFFAQAFLDYSLPFLFPVSIAELEDMNYHAQILSMEMMG